MTKAIVSAAMVCMLFVLPVAFYIIQTVEGQDNNAVTAIDARDSGTDVNSVGSYTDVSGGNSAGSNSGGSGDNSAGSNSDGTTAIDARDSGTDVNSVGSYTDVSGDNSAGSNSNGITAINARDSGTDVNSVGSYTEVGCDGCNNKGSGGKDGSCDGCHDGDHKGGHCDHGGTPNGNSGGSSSDYEISVKEHACYNSSNVVINEIYPCTETCIKSGIGGIELYNTGNTPVNVSQWYLENITGYVMAPIKNEEISPHGFLVVGVVGLTRNYQEINLVDSCGNKVCSVLYTGATYNSGLSYARIPDGGNMWKWMTATLGYSNMQGTS